MRVLRARIVSCVLAPVAHSGKRCLQAVLPPLLLASVWEFLTRAGLINQRVLPPFTAVLVAWLDLLQQGDVFSHLLVSLYRAIVGLTLGSFVGIALGILMALSSLAHDLIDPFVSLTFTLPKTAFIPIAILWLGVGDSSTILVVFLSTLVPMIVSAYHGARAVPHQLTWSARAMGASRLRILTSVVFPASMAYVTNAFRISLAFSVVVVISAEMVAAQAGIGKFVLLYSESGSYNYMFAVILTIVAVAFGLDRGFLIISRCWLGQGDRNGRVKG